MSQKRVSMAIVYDFDGTLAPGNMQEHHFIPKIKIKKEKFWREADELVDKHQADPILMYMHLMLRKADEAGVSIRRNDFKEHGRKIRLFEGVLGWFDRITKYGKSKDVRIEHYLVSSGNAEIIAGTPIKRKFKKIYASKFLFNQNDIAIWPALAINYTTKTQYLFRINKGAHDLSDNTGINKFTARKDRPIPFENMIYIGDGDTDIPCFRLVKDQGGTSIAVYKTSTKGARKKAETYLRDERVHCIAPAIYTEDSNLDKTVKAGIDVIAARKTLTELSANKMRG